MRTLNAEEATRRLAIEHEHRVSKLEEKLSQFSDLASKYNKNRQEDQDMIVKLKVREHEVILSRDYTLYLYFQSCIMYTNRIALCSWN